MSNSANFTIAYDGPALANHEMDARDLGYALLALCSLIEESSKEIYGKDCKTSVTIKGGFKPGSFEIDYVIAQSYIQQILGIFASDGVSGALNLMACIGLGGSTVYGVQKGAFQVIKFLRGKRPDKVIVQPDLSIKFVLGNQEIIGLPFTDKLYRSISVRREFSKVMSPLDKDGVTSFEIRQAGKTLDAVSKDESAYFYDPSTTEEVNSETLLGTSDLRKTFSIASLDFKPGNKWRLSDGSGQFHVEILDKEFLEGVSLNRTSFYKDDLLLVDLRINEFQTPKGLRTDYQILKVLEHRQAAKQLELTYST